MQMGFYFDQTRCTGCYTCTVACKDWHNVPPGPASWRRVFTTEKGKYPDTTVSFFSLACHHCVNPACVNACPVNAINKDATNGIVTVNRDTCLGKDKCGVCLDACPWEIPQFDAEPDAKMQKCDFCTDRLKENKPPVCVAACPMRALDFGPMDGLVQKYGNVKECEGFADSEDLNPSFIVKPKQKH